MRISNFLLGMGVLSSCSHWFQSNWPHESAYQQALAVHSQQFQTYHGILGTFQTFWVFLSPGFLKRYLEFSADIYRWDQAQLDQHWNEWKTRLQQSTVMWLGFYVSDRRQRLMRFRHQWEISLWQGSSRWVGRIKPWKVTRSQMRIIVPQAHPWYDWFEVEFPTPAANLREKEAKVVIAGPYGQHEWNIKPEMWADSEGLW